MCESPQRAKKRVLYTLELELLAIVSSCMETELRSLQKPQGLFNARDSSPTPSGLYQFTITRVPTKSFLDLPNVPLLDSFFAKRCNTLIVQVQG